MWSVWDSLPSSDKVLNYIHHLPTLYCSLSSTFNRSLAVFLLSIEWQQLFTLPYSLLLLHELVSDYLCDNQSWNYSLVSILPALINVLDRYVTTKLIEHLKNNSAIKENQISKGTKDLMLYFSDYVNNQLNKGKQVLVISTDSAVEFRTRLQVL